MQAAAGGIVRRGVAGLACVVCVLCRQSVFLATVLKYLESSHFGRVLQGWRTRSVDTASYGQL